MLCIRIRSLFCITTISLWNTGNLTFKYLIVYIQIYLVGPKIAFILCFLFVLVWFGFLGEEFIPSSHISFSCHVSSVSREDFYDIDIFDELAIL